MAKTIPDYDDPPPPPLPAGNFAALIDGEVQYVDPAALAQWIKANPHERPPGWNIAREQDSVRQYLNTPPEEREAIYAGRSPHDVYAGVQTVGNTNILLAPTVHQAQVETPTSAYASSKKRTSHAARKALATSDKEGRFVDTGLTSYREGRRGDTIYASAEPFQEYKYDPAALRQAEMDTKRDKLQYEAERTRKGKQDPAPTLGPSMAEQ